MKIAVIPARGGSKRIPRKNVRKFNGMPMIGYAINAARESELFDAIVVSTDDDEIAEVAISFGAVSPFRRPAELADDHTITAPVIGHAVKWFQERGEKIDSACCIYPCVPFLKATLLVDTYNLFFTKKVNFVYPVVEFQASPWQAMIFTEDGSMKFIFPEFELTRTQDLAKCYVDAGLFYWGSSNAWLSGLKMHSGGHGYIIPSTNFVDIDTEEDWRRAEIFSKYTKYETT